MGNLSPTKPAPVWRGEPRSAAGSRVTLGYPGRGGRMSSSAGAAAGPQGAGRGGRRQRQRQQQQLGRLAGPGRGRRVRACPRTRPGSRHAGQALPAAVSVPSLSVAPRPRASGRAPPRSAGEALWAGTELAVPAFPLKPNGCARGTASSRGGRMQSSRECAAGNLCCRFSRSFGEWPSCGLLVS